jgi:glycolate oxidase iron-sulfur subunit
MTETSGPRGRISLIRAVGEGRLDVLSPGFVEQMSQCLDCRACEAACPSGVRYGQLIETARAQIQRARAPMESAKNAFARRFLVRTLFSQPANLRAFARLLRFAQRSGLAALAPLFGLGSQARLAPRIGNRFFEAADQRYDANPSAGTAFLHAGCIMPLAFAGVHDATVRMLRRAGLSVIVPRDQGCCGAVAVHAGDIDFGRELAKRNIAAFEASKADVYVVDTAGCGSSLKEYVHLFEGDAQWALRARAFSSRVRDVIEVLDAMPFDSNIGRIDATVTYQEPCHLAHAQRITAAPRRLLARVPGLRLIEMDESAVCCGSAGTYSLTQPEMSARLRRRKVDNVLRTRADIIATANPGCAMTLEAGLRADGSTLPVKHVVEILDDAYTAYSVAATRS